MINVSYCKYDPGISSSSIYDFNFSITSCQLELLCVLFYDHCLTYRNRPRRILYKYFTLYFVFTSCNYIIENVSTVTPCSAHRLYVSNDAKFHQMNSQILMKFAWILLNISLIIFYWANPTICGIAFIIALELWPVITRSSFVFASVKLQIYAQLNLLILRRRKNILGW